MGYFADIASFHPTIQGNVVRLLNDIKGIFDSLEDQKHTLDLLHSYAQDAAKDVSYGHYSIPKIA